LDKEKRVGGGTGEAKQKNGKRTPVRNRVGALAMVCVKVQPETRRLHGL